jgi:hypothetical protein
MTVRFSGLISLLILGAFTRSPAAEIGERVPNLTFKDIRYVNRSLDDFPKAKAFAIVFVDAGCPLAQRYLPTVEKIAIDYRDKGVAVVAMDSGVADSIPAVAALAVRHNCSFPFVKDLDGDGVRTLGVTRTPECVVLDANRKLRYRGRIDDQYRPTGSRSEATTHELRDALDAVLADKAVAVTTTAVDGCPITRPAPAEKKGVTFTKDVAPILKNRCQECHRPGTVAPFALQTYEQVTKRAGSIADVIGDGRMPPWHAAPEFEFANRRTLSSDERETLLTWLRSPDRPRGDEKVAPAPLPPAGEWRIGTPDFVVTAPQHELPATGDVAYKYAVLPTVFLQDTWVQDVEIKPDNPRVMHHCNMAYIKAGEKFRIDNFITGQVPGGTPMHLYENVGYKIPAGSLLILQIHYVTTGKPEACKISVGFRYARETIDKQLRLLYFATNRFAIPPGAGAHPVKVTLPLPCDGVVVGLFSHMHLRGKDMTFRAKYPDGNDETLLMIANYSFDWQQPYVYSSPGKKLPKGTKVECLAHYDNSAFNPFNPDPSATVREGPQTYHEMMNGFLFYVDENEKLGLKIDEKSGHVQK